MAKQASVIYKSWPNQIEVEVQADRNALNTWRSGLTEFELLVYKQGLLWPAELIFCSFRLQYISVNFNQRSSSAWGTDSDGFSHAHTEHYVRLKQKSEYEILFVVLVTSLQAFCKQTTAMQRLKGSVGTEWSYKQNVFLNGKLLFLRIFGALQGYHLIMFHFFCLPIPALRLF